MLNKSEMDGKSVHFMEFYKTFHDHTVFDEMNFEFMKTKKDSLINTIFSFVFCIFNLMFKDAFNIFRS